MVLTMLGLANVGLTLAEVGNFEALRYLGFALTAFWLNALGTAFLRVRQDTNHAERWFVYYLLIVLLGSLLVFGLFASGTHLLGAMLIDTPDVQFGLAFGTYLMGTLAGSAVEQEAIADRASGRLLAYSLSSNGLQLVVFLGALLLGFPMVLAMWTLAASAVYRVAWAALRYLRKQDVRLPLAVERQQFWSTASSLSLYGLAAAAVVIVDHALVGYSAQDPKQSMSIWRYGAQELPLLVGVVSGLNATALAERQDGDALMLDNLKRRTVRLSSLILPAAILLMATSRWWFPFLFTEAFAPSHVLFNTLLLIVPTRLVLTTPLLISHDLHAQMTRVGVIENVINIVISLALVPFIGMLGIAIGTVVAFSIERLVYVRMLNERGIRLSQYVDLSRWSILSGILVLTYAFMTDFLLILPY